MCLNFVKTEEATKKWLSKKPDTIIAYKVVNKKYDGKYYPICMGTHQAFRNGTNRLRERSERIRKKFIDVYKYVPHYHLFVTLEGAKDWFSAGAREVILKCEIKKKDITAVGTQFDRRSHAIVTKAFKIVEEVYDNQKYYEDHVGEV